MKPTTADELRRAFLGFFEAKGHTPLPSSSLVPNDPSLLLTTAGMVQFKPYMLGEEKPPWPRATTVQKCFRTTDIDIIGTTARHLTFFEMLGNFSLGDYFKEDAIPFAWELATTVFELDPERIWVTVFETDDESIEIWANDVGVPRERIQRRGEEDNFWAMGPTGPCGPCSELYYDRGPEFGGEGGPAEGGEERYVEFWNLVFMQYNRAEDGTLTDLPQRNIDTGAGLERILALLQGEQSVFETDVLRRILAVAEATTGRRYGADAKADVSLRILADHGRAMTFLLADGVLPANEGRGYVLRRQHPPGRPPCPPPGLRGARSPGRWSTPPSRRWAAPTPTWSASTTSSARGRRGGGPLRRDAAPGPRPARRPPGQGRRVGRGRLLPPRHPRLPGRGDGRDRRRPGPGGRPGRLPGTDGGAAASRPGRPGSEPAPADGDGAGGGRPTPPGPAFADLLDASGPNEFVGYGEAVTDRPGRGAARQDRNPSGRAEAGRTVDVILDRTPFYAESGGQVGDVGIDRDRRRHAAGPRHRLRRAAEADPPPGRGRVGPRGRRVGGHRPHRRRPPGAHPPQPHRHPPAALGAARRPGRAREAGRFAGQSPDRLRFDFSHYEGVPAEVLARVEAQANEEVLVQRLACGSTRRPRNTPSRSAPSPSSATSTATSSGWWRPATTRWSCAAAPTSTPSA